MPSDPLADAMHDPVVWSVLAVIGLLLLWTVGRELRKVPPQLRVLMATAFLDMVGLLMIVPLVPFYVDRYAAGGVTLAGIPLGTGTLAGLIAAAFTLAQLLSAPFWGRFSDSNGRRPALLIALGGSAIAYVLFGFADSLPMLFLSRLVLGAGGGTVGVIQAYVADSTAPQDRARALGWLSAATNLGVALGPVIGKFAFDFGKVDLWPGAAEFRLGHGCPGFVAAALCLLTIVFARRHLPESKANTPAGAVRKSPREAFWYVLSQPTQPASRLILTYAIAIGAFQGINAVLALFLNRRFGVTEQTIGWFYLYIGAISVFARTLLLGRLVDRLGEVRLSRVGIVTLATGIAGVAVATSLPWLAIAVALLPLGTAFTFPCVTGLLSRVVPQQDRGLWMGLQQTYGGIARIAMPLLYGTAFDSIAFAAPFWISATLVIATLGLGIGLVAPPRAPAART
ncbi:MAG: MFS transporter [Planctomycetes bacterium]|nr:MFS transporter [Planctomycetota bacterium]